MKSFINTLLSLIFLCAALAGQTVQRQADFRIARLQYSGGGDWYNDPSSLPNMMDYLRAHTTIRVADEDINVSLNDEDLFAHPFLFMTGHGRISFSERETERLHTFLTNGGFLYADDDYGMDEYFRREMKRVFPDKELVQVPFSHPIFHCHFDFPDGLPKIHEHDGGPPQAFAYFHNGHMVAFYSFNTNISDGWPDPQVHGDPPDVRERAFQMGTNIIIYALTQ